MSKVHLSRRARLRLGASMAVIAVSLAAAGAAGAQTAPADNATDVDEVVVTGFRGSLASAISVKRLEAAAVDAIKA